MLRITAPILASVALLAYAALRLPAAPARVLDNFVKLPLSFIENRGQADERVAYYIQSPGHSLYFTRAGHAMRLTEGTGEDLKAHTVKVELVDAAAERIEGLDRAPGVVSYFKGSREQWKTGIPTHARIGYVQPWPGIDLAYDGHQGKLESIYTIAPHADPAQIRLRYSGQDDLRLDGAGNLIYTTSVGEVKETAPVSYQDIGGKRVPVESRYSLLDKNTVGFEVAAYDAGHPLVIDPTLVYSGFIGGDDWDAAQAIAVDSSGNAYVAGYAYSTEASFPVTVGPDLSHNLGGMDAYVAKVSADGSVLIYAGYIGGTDTDRAYGIAVDSAGNAYITGATSGVNAGFPVVGGPDLTYNGGYNDAFVAKLSADGSTLVYSGYIGGLENDPGSGIAVDGSGNAYVTGYTSSSEQSFPVVVGPDLTSNGYRTDAFIAKVSADGTALVYAGYIGGDGDDFGAGVAVDGNGNAYVTGLTTSPEASFPVAGGPDLSYNGGDSDAFVAKVNAQGDALDYAGFVGGSGNDSGAGIAVDGAGNAYITGSAGTTAGVGFPVVGGPDPTYNGGYNDGFVAKVNAQGDAFDYLGFVGGSANDSGHGIAVDSDGNAYVTGSTDSAGTSFPAFGGPGPGYSGGGDAFVAKVGADGSVPYYARYIGGSASDAGNGIAVDSAGNAFVAGQTSSTEADGFPVIGGPDSSHNGFSDAFVVKIAAAPAPEPDAAPEAFTFNTQADVDRGVSIASNAVTLSGFNERAVVSLSGDATSEYSIGCTTGFTTSASTVSNGQTVCVRHTTAASYSAATTTTLTVGGVVGVFTSTTWARDTTPDRFYLHRSYDVPPRATVATTVTITGITEPVAISVSGDATSAYSIGCTSNFTSTPGTIGNGQAVCVRHVASASYSTSTSTKLTVGGVSDTWISDTFADPAAPPPISYGEALANDLGKVVTFGGGFSLWSALLGLLAAALRSARDCTHSRHPTRKYP